MDVIEAISSKEHSAGLMNSDVTSHFQEQLREKYQLRITNSIYKELPVSMLYSKSRSKQVQDQFTRCFGDMKEFTVDVPIAKHRGFIKVWHLKVLQGKYYC